MQIKVLEAARAHVGKIMDLGYQGKTALSRDPNGKVRADYFFADTVIGFGEKVYDIVLIEETIITATRTEIIARNVVTRAELRPVWTDNARSIIKLNKVEIL